MTAALRLATRGSPLARWQAEHVAALLDADVELVIVSTRGDERRDVPIWEIGGTGIFVKEVQEAVLTGRADAAVHSAKDLPSLPAPGLVIAAVPVRADPRDALVGSTLADLPAAARIGTGSVRRRAQLAAYRPDLTFASLRGNIETRVKKAADHDAVVVAAAALDRLGLEQHASEVLDPQVMLPQVAQGALAVECRPDDDRVRAALVAIDDDVVHRCVRAERAFLAALAGGCNIPCGALATEVGGTITIDALLASPDGRVVLRTTSAGSDPEAVGAAVAARILDDLGGRPLLEP